MAKCIGNCSACELDVDKVVCCTFQSLKQTLQLRSEIRELREKMNMLGSDARKPVSGLDKIDNAEPDAPGAVDE